MVFKNNKSQFILKYNKYTKNVIFDLINKINQEYTKLDYIINLPVFWRC